MFQLKSSTDEEDIKCDCVWLRKPGRGAVLPHAPVSDGVALLSVTRSANDARGAKREVKTEKGVEDDERRWRRIK